MAFAQGSRSGLSFVVESTFGTTPGSPSMVNLPYNTHSLTLGKESLESAEIRSDRLTNIFRHGNRNVAGTIDVDFRADDFDDLLESAFFSTLDSVGVMKIGTTPKHLTIEDRAEDITQYRQFTGATVSSMAMTIEPNAIVTASFDMVGKDMAQAQTPLDAAITDSSNNEPFDSFTGTLLEGGGAIATVTSLDFTVDNSVEPTFVVGDATTPQVEFGRASITGNVSIYYEDATLIDKFINETESSLSIALTDGVSGNIYTFLFPRIKYNDAAVPVEDEQSRIITLPFVALRDAVEETNLKLTIS